MQSHRNVLVPFVLFLSLLSLSFGASAQTVTRGPYLQTGTPTSVYVKWRTSSATNSTVRYGLTAGNLSQTASNASATAEHEIQLTGLSADTQYFYSVGTSTQTLAGGSSYFFVTAPPTGTVKPTRIWVLGDSGTANASAAAVRDGYHTFNAGSPYADLWLMLGDNAYDDGTDAEFQAAVFDMYPQTLRQSVLWPTLGNHDGHTATASSQTGPYFDIFKLPTAGEAGGAPSATEAYYSFNYGNIHFVCLESYQTITSGTGRAAMLQWLDGDLAANTQPWVIVFWHHPPYTKGSHNSDTENQLVLMRENANPIIEAHGVDLVLTGHSHSYERSFLLDGHYGVSSTFNNGMKVDGGDGRPAGNGAYEKPNMANVPHSGAVYTVAGSSGKVSGGTLDHPAMYLSLSVLGSVVLDVNGDRLDATFLGTAGNVIDSYTIQKGADTTPPQLLSAVAEGAISEVVAVFSEAVEETSAETAANYVIDNGVTVSAASLGADLKTVTLTTSPLSQGISYTLTVNNVTDLAANVIGAGNQQAFTYTEIITESFQDGVAPNTSYSGTRDTYISQANAASNFGSATTVQVDGDDPSGSGQDLVTLLKWDISSIPAGATVDSAEIAMSVTNASGGPYPAYAALRDWVETQANWNQAASGVNWGSPGAAGASDRGTDPVATFSGAAGPATYALNAAGLALVQSWIDTPASNRGIIVASPTTADGLDLSSRNSGTAANRPKLTVRYTLPGGDSEAPTAPGNLRSTATTVASIDLAWDASTDNVGVTEYRLSRNGGFLASVAGTTYSDTGLTPDTSYNYTVEAFDAAGNGSGASGTLVVATLADTTPPAAPSNLISTGATETTIDLSWNAATDNIGVTGYRIFRDGGEVGTTGSTTYTDSGLTIDTSYEYTVRAFDAAGNESSDSNLLAVSTAADTTPPSAPSGLTSTGQTETTVGLSWNAATDNVAVTNYRVYRNGSPVTTLNATSYTDTGLTASTSYSYFVTALDAALNESGQSNTINVATSGTSETLVHIGALTMELRSAGKNRYARAHVTIVDASAGAVPNATVNGVWTEIPTGSTSVNVNGVTAADGTVQFDSPPVPKSANGQFILNILGVNGTGLVYDSSADVASSGCITNGGSSCSAPPPDTTPPAAPTGLIATGATGSIQLNWTGNTESDLASYSVYRADTPAGPFALIATGVPVSNYTDSGLPNSTSRSYRVAAVDISGNESAQSATATATTTSGGGGTQVYVSSLAVTVANQGKNWRGVASLMIMNTNSSAVPNATVSGQWRYNGSLQGTFSGVTDGNGAVSISSQNVKANSGDSFTFNVTNVQASGATYNPSLNVSSSGSALVP